MSKEEQLIMKIHLPIFFFSVFLGLLLLAADVVIDEFYLKNTLVTLPFVGMVSASELLMRFLILSLFVISGTVCGRLLFQYQEAETGKSETAAFLNQLIEAVPIPVFYKDADNIYIGCNGKFSEFLKMDRRKIIGKSVYDIAPTHLAEKYHQMDMELLNNPGIQVYEAEVADEDNKISTVIFHKATYYDTDGRVAGMIGLIFDVSELRQVEREREQVVVELQDALAQVKTLGGFLPICSSCKKIRDDSGYWQRLETYLKKSTDVDFSHSICPACSEQLFEEYAAESRQESEEAGGGSLPSGN